ncbi:hypothetical protein [Mycetohabitans endofungorum]|uniref:hypothetical protein n=1 Tax=Mycetohabitans endofungorum TaxID=417203 RepID=UPI002B054DC9|nr:hypothetical protein [Mycetohabitans endofungorum]
MRLTGAASWGSVLGYFFLFPFGHRFLLYLAIRQRTRSRPHQLDANCFTSRKHRAQLSEAATTIQVIAALSAGLKDCKAHIMMHSSLLSSLKTADLEQMKNKLELATQNHTIAHAMNEVQLKGVSQVTVRD